MKASLTFWYIIVQSTIIQLEACNRMSYVNPIELQEMNKENVPLSKEFREMLGKQIDRIIGNKMDKI